MLIALPVLPLLASTMVSPGRSSPSRSARSIMYLAIRALIDPDGLRYSSLTQIPSPRSVVCCRSRRESCRRLAAASRWQAPAPCPPQSTRQVPLRHLPQNAPPSWNPHGRSPGNRLVTWTNSMSTPYHAVGASPCWPRALRKSILAQPALGRRPDVRDANSRTRPVRSAQHGERSSTCCSLRMTGIFS